MRHCRFVEGLPDQGPEFCLVKHNTALESNPVQCDGWRLAPEAAVQIRIDTGQDIIQSV